MLRLPNHVLQDLAAAGKLQRTRSLVAFRASRGGSTHHGDGFGGRSIQLGQSGWSGGGSAAGGRVGEAAARPAAGWCVRRERRWAHAAVAREQAEAAALGAWEGGADRHGAGGREERVG